MGAECENEGLSDSYHELLGEERKIQRRSRSQVGGRRELCSQLALYTTITQYMRLCCAFKIRTEDWISKLLALSVLLRAFVPVYAFAGPRGSYTYIWAGVILPHSVGSSKARYKHPSWFITTKQRLIKYSLTTVFGEGGDMHARGSRGEERCVNASYGGYRKLFMLWGWEKLSLAKWKRPFVMKRHQLTQHLAFPSLSDFPLQMNYMSLHVAIKRLERGVPKKGSLCHLHSFTWN